MDNTGQMSALGGFVNSLGLATGPAIAAYLVGDGNLHLVVMFAVRLSAAAAANIRDAEEPLYELQRWVRVSLGW